MWGSDRAIESARGFATDTAARPARRPTPAPIASFRHCHRTTPGEGRNWEKNMRRGARGPGGARGVGGAETLGGIAPGVGSDAFAAEATSTGRSRAFDHPKPRANPAGGEGWITPPPRTHGRKPRKVNREKKMSRRGRGPYAPETTRVAHPRSPRWSVRTSTSQNKELTSSSSAPGSPLVAARAEDRGADFSCVRLRFGIGIEVGSAAPASGSSPWASAPPMISRGKKAGGSVHSCTRTVRAARGRGRGRAPCTRGAKSRQLGGGSPLAEKNAGAPRNRLGCGFPDV